MLLVTWSNLQSIQERLWIPRLRYACKYFRNLERRTVANICIGEGKPEASLYPHLVAREETRFSKESEICGERPSVKGQRVYSSSRSSDGDVKRNRWGWDTVQLVECLPSVHKALGLNPSTAQQGRFMLTYTPSTWEIDVGGLQVQSHLWLHTHTLALMSLETEGFGPWDQLELHRKKKKRRKKDPRNMKNNKSLIWRARPSMLWCEQDGSMDTCVLATHVWQPEFNPWNPCKCWRREPTPQGYPLTSTCVPLHVYTPHTHKLYTCKNE